jgi:hypothetical protein
MRPRPFEQTRAGGDGVVGDCSSCRVKGAAIQADARAQSPISLTAYLTGFDEFGGSAVRTVARGRNESGEPLGLMPASPQYPHNCFPSAMRGASSRETWPAAASFPWMQCNGGQQVGHLLGHNPAPVKI